MTQVTGYRVLTDAEVAEINEIKNMGIKVGKLVDDLASTPDFDQRWVAIGKTHLQQGFMALTRAIAKPGGF